MLGLIYFLLQKVIMTYQGFVIVIRRAVGLLKLDAD